jgi:hypothetical protein
VRAWAGATGKVASTSAPQLDDGAVARDDGLLVDDEVQAALCVRSSAAGSGSRARVHLDLRPHGLEDLFAKFCDEAERAKTVRKGGSTCRPCSCIARTA